MINKDNQLLAHIRILREAMDNNKLVIFVGAGVSLNSGIPAWNGLIKSFRDELNLPDWENDYLKIAQIYKNVRGQKESLEKIRQVLKHKQVVHNEINKAIFELTPAHVLTTNYDDLLEQVILKQALPYSVIRQDTDFPYAQSRNLLVKMHGDLDLGNIVLTDDDYLEYEERHPLTVAFLRSLFTSHVVLFIGYSYSDFDLKQIVQQVRNLLGEDFQRAYLLQPGDINQAQENFLLNKGVTPIAFERLDSYLSVYLKQSSKYIESKNLKREGKQLFDMLSFIRLFDGFVERLNQEPVLVQMHESLIRFSELKSLPPDFVTKLFPFKVNNSGNSYYDYLGLNSNNSDLTKFFFENVDSTQNPPVLNPEYLKQMQEMGVRDAEEKFSEILRKLVNSHIFYVENNEVPAKRPSKRRYSYVEIWSKSEENCTCFSCEWQRFNIASVLSKLKTGTVTETSEIREDLNFAYILAKTDEYYQAYQMYKTIAYKAWRQGKYLSYFIANQNIKLLRNLLLYRTDGINEEEKQIIKREIDTIDLDKILFQITISEAPERELLKKIKEHALVNETDTEVEKLLWKIREIYEGYKRGGYWSMSPNYPSQVLVEMSILHTLYSYNHILTDEYDHFKSVINKGLAAFLYSYATPDKYDQKLKHLDATFFKMSLLHGDIKRLKAEFRFLDLKNLDYAPESLNEILELFNNFLTSFFKKSLTSIDISAVNAQLENHYFRDRMASYFEMATFLLSKTELPIGEGEILIQNLIAFLEHEKFLYDLNYLPAFLSLNKNLLTFKDWERLFSLLAVKSKYCENQNFVAVICNIHSTNFQNEKIGDNVLIDAILHQMKKGRRLKNNTNYTLLWNIVDSSNQQIMKDKAINTLHQKFDEELYRLASLMEVLDYNLFFEEYLAQIAKTANSGRFGIDDHHDTFYHEFINFILFIAQLAIPLNDKRLRGILPNAGFLSFLLYPNKFDYTEFDIRWLEKLCHNYYYDWFRNVKALKKNLEVWLKGNQNEEVQKFYFNCFCHT